MSEFMVTDLSDLYPATLAEEMPAAARRLRSYLSDIVWAATARPSGPWSATPLPCRRRPGRRPCPGRLEVRRQDIPPEVHWRCPRCEDAGLVSGWRGLPPDFTGSPPAPVDPEGAVVREARITEEEYALLRESVVVLDADADRIVAGARPTGDEVILEGRLDDFDLLLDAVAFEANHAESRPLQDRLDALSESLARVEDRWIEGEDGFRYDPEKGPEPSEWLELDEDKRLLAVEDYHLWAGDELPNASLHAVFHVVVENQIAEGEEVVLDALHRLQGEGLNRHEAIHAVASVLAREVIKARTAPPDVLSMDPGRQYLERLESLTAEEWRKRRL